jgi:pimeloyl-ACP methyl ester carboxylesterase
MSQRILLIHGLLNANYWLWLLAARLRAKGFGAEIFGYPSVLGGPEQAIDRLIKKLCHNPVGALIGHSLGGLIALEALRQMSDAPVSRVVCMGSPLRGSETAHRIAARRWSRPLLGHSAALLHNGLDAWQGPAAVGMIAGDVARGTGRLFGDFQGISDGTVTLEETRLPGLTGHCIVHASHSGLLFSTEAAAQAAHFLREGRFGKVETEDLRSCSKSSSEVGYYRNETPLPQRHQSRPI